jgi:hypothetical protein
LWPTDAAGFDKQIDGLIEALPEQADNLRRLRNVVREATATSDPAAHDRLDVEYDAIIELIEAATEATLDATRPCNDLPATERIRDARKP